MKRIKSIQEGNVQELEKFADTLASTVVTLREHGRWSELDPGSLLYTVVLEKIPKSMLSRFYRWVKESGRPESIETLRDWITEKSEYQVKAVETVEGLHGAKGKPKEDDRKRWNRTFTTFKPKCYICQGNHSIRNCEEYKSMATGGKLLKKKNYVFVVWLIITKEGTVKERKNVELMAAREITTDSCINPKKFKPMN